MNKINSYPLIPSSIETNTQTRKPFNAQFKKKLPPFPYKLSIHHSDQGLEIEEL